MAFSSLKHIALRSAWGAAAVLLVTSGFAQNLITNGSFETEDASVVTQTYGTLGTDPSPNGWSYVASASGPLSYAESNNDSTRPSDSANGNAQVDAEDGLWYISYGAYTSDPSGAPMSQADYDSMQQRVTTEAGKTYDLSYSLYELGVGEGGTTGDYFNVTWDGSVVAGTQITDNLTSSKGWVTYTATIQGDGNAHTIGFNGFNNSSWLNLDNVSLTAQAVPEPSAFAALGLGLVGLFIKRRK